MQAIASPGFQAPGTPIASVGLKPAAPSSETPVASVGLKPKATPVGQAAKTAVAGARAAGVDLPKNAQGKAASAIAQGAEPASVFAAQTASAPEPDPAVSEPAVSDEDLQAAAAAAGYDAAKDAVGGGGFAAGETLDNSASIALQLLKTA